MRTSPFVPSRFRSEISRHLTLSFAEIPEYPLILGLFGPPGEGKTFQTKATLSALNVVPLSVNAADLESERAGQPGRLLLENYLTAARHIERGHPTVMMIDDIDTTVGEWEKNTGTVNHQQVLAQLMGLADSPTFIQGIGTIRRVPVIVTGNDLTKIYAPLKRHGRMRTLPWEPSSEEKREILRVLLAGMADDRLVDQLVDRFGHLPVSFFGQLKAEAVVVAADSIVHKIGDFRKVVQDPAKYAKYIRASLNGDLDLVALAENMAKIGNAADRSFLRPREIEAHGPMLLESVGTDPEEAVSEGEQSAVQESAVDEPTGASEKLDILRMESVPPNQFDGWQSSPRPPAPQPREVRSAGNV